MRDLLRPPRYPPSPHDDPAFPRAAAWLSWPCEGPPAARVLGVPFSALSISKARCDLLPADVRAAMWSFSTYLASRDVELSSLAVADAGDVDVDGLDPHEALRRIEDACASLRDGPPVAVVGGDNSITAPAMLGLVGAGGSLLTLDAHHDVRAGLSNGSPVRVLLEAGIRRVHQIGIADLANSKAYADYARERGVTWVGPRADVGEAVRAALHSLPAPVYVDIDIDVADRAFAPGAPAAMPGGLRPADLACAAFLCGAHRGVRALDVVEVDPGRDVAGITVRLAAWVLLHFLAGVATR